MASGFAESSSNLLVSLRRALLVADAEVVSGLLRELKSDERSLGCVSFSGTGGMEILPGHGKRFARRALKNKGYTVVMWVRPSLNTARFELLGIGGGALRIEVEPSGEAKWTISVYSKGRLKGSTDVSMATDEDWWSAASGDGSFKGPWRMVSVVHSWRYLSQPSLEIDAGGHPKMKVSAALPTEEDCDNWCAVAAEISARSALRPPALRVLRGFTGICGNVVVYEGSASAYTLAALREAGPRFSAARTPQMKPTPGERKLANFSTPPVLPKICVSVSSQNVAGGALGAWCPRGGDNGDLELPSSCSAAERASSLFMTGDGVQVEAGGVAARCRDAIASLGGLRLLAAALDPFGAQALYLCAAWLDTAGPAHAAEALQNRALFAIAARVSSSAGDDGDGIVDAIYAVVDSTAKWPRLQSASLEAFFVVCGMPGLLKRAADRSAPLVFSRPADARPAHRRFAASLRYGVGIGRLARFSRRIKADEAHFDNVDSLRVVASAALLDELLPNADEDNEEEHVTMPITEDRGVVEILDAVKDDTDDTDGRLRAALLEALALAISRANVPVRARVASILRQKSFAETSALALLKAPGAPCGTTTSDRVRSSQPFFQAHDCSLRSSTLKLALWQYTAAEKAMRHAIANTIDGDDRREQAEAKKRFKRSAAAAASKLSSLVTESLDKIISNQEKAAEAHVLALVLGFDVVAAEDEDEERASESKASSELGPPPLWLTLPFLAVLLPHLSPTAAAERAVAGACARIKSSNNLLADLEPWYSVGSLMRLASRCRGTTVELLALDVVSSLVLQRRQRNVSGVGGGGRRQKSIQHTFLYDLDRGALAWCAAAVPTATSEAVANLEWASRALAAVVASACRRLAAELSRAIDENDDESSTKIPTMIAKLVAVCLDKILPPPSPEGFSLLGEARGCELASSIADAARAVRRCNERALRLRMRAEASERAAYAERGSLRTADSFRRSFTSFAKRALSDGFGASSSQAPDAVASASAQDAKTQESGLISLRQCTRALAHAAFWAVQEPSLAVNVCVEIRSCVALGVELADERVSRGSPSAAVVASDDALHATACLGARFERLDDDELKNAFGGAITGLVRDCVQSVGLGLATACVRAALEPAALSKTPEAVLAALKRQLESALARDAADREDFVEDLPTDFWAASRSSTSIHRGGINAILSFTDDQHSVVAAFRNAERVDAARAVASRALADEWRVDVAAELDDKFGIDARGNETKEGEQLSQLRWELYQGNGHSTPSLVAYRSEQLKSPLTAHDDDEEMSSFKKSFEASMPDPSVAKKLGNIRDVASSSSIMDIDNDDDEEDSNRESMATSSSDIAAEPAPAQSAGVMLRSFRPAEDEPVIETTPAKTAVATTSDVKTPSRDAEDNDDPRASITGGTSLGPTDGPFSDASATSFSFMTGKVWCVERQRLTAGTVAINRTKKWLVFRPSSEKKKLKTAAWRMRDVAAVLLRRYRLRDTAVEIYFKHSPTLFIDCAPRRSGGEGGEGIDDDDDDAEDEADPVALSYSAEAYNSASRRRDDLVKRVITCVRAARGVSSDGIFPLLQPPRTSPGRLLRKATRAWQERRLTNYDYLCIVNALGGRSYADPCQYPVFPWILADYESDQLDLSDPDSYRDLSKPMGALNETRLRETIARYESFVDPHVPRFHYGSHYSTSAGVVMHYLLRMAPFSEMHCELQGGRFDVADRLFASIREAWSANSGVRGTLSSSEVKEVTPEWYATPAFLVNRGRMPLGVSQDGDVVGDVELPPWAGGSPHAFVAANRAALESDIVSAKLHLWIDLIFGHKQRGPAAVEAHNVFFYLCYADAVDLDNIEDPKLRASTVLQASHFGTCPTQLMGSRMPHPPRGPKPSYIPRLLLPDDDVPLAFASMALGESAEDDSLAVAESSSLVAVAKEWEVASMQQQGHAVPSTLRKPTPIIALRASTNICVGIDSSGAICAFSWAYDRVEIASDEDDAEMMADEAMIPESAMETRKRRASLRPLGCDTLDDGTDSNVVDAATLGTFYGGSGSLTSPSSLVSISADCRYVAAPEATFPRALRLVELGAAKAADASIAVRGESSVVACDAPITLVRLFGGDDDEDLFALVGSLDGSVAVWRIHRSGKFFGRRHSLLSRWPDCVLRGHGSPVAAGDADARLLRVAVTAGADGAVLVHSLRSGDHKLLRRLTGPAPGRRALSICLSAPRARAVVCFGAVIEVHSVNGGLITATRLAYIPSGIRVVGTRRDALLCISHDRFELLAMEAGLAPVRTVAADTFHNQAARVSPPLLDVDLGPDPDAPAAVFAATADSKVAVRILYRTDDFFDKRALNDASVGAIVAARASQVIGLAAAALGKGHDLKSSAEAFSTEAISWVATTRKTIVNKIQKTNSGMISPPQRQGQERASSDEEMSPVPSPPVPVHRAKSLA